MNLTLDEDGYPTEESINEIKDFQNFMDLGPKAFLSEIKKIWAYSDCGYWSEEVRNKETIYHISTAGWSGNEEIIGAMQANYIFWAQHWFISRRGGHYIFKVKNDKV